MMESGIFKRTELLVGTTAMERIDASRVIIFGVGGVGSWCAESLIRSGIGHITLVDSDKVCSTNINRQLMATTNTVGQLKVEVLKARLLSINPQADILALGSIYCEQSSASFQLHTYDYIIDAIDSLKHKVHLILAATQTDAVLVSSMGAALKLDPSKIKVAEFWKVQGCPLGASLRRRMNKENKPSKKFLCVYSDEVLSNKGEVYEQDESKTSAVSQQENGSKKAQINGTIAHITAIFGFTLAGIVMQDICNE